MEKFKVGVSRVLKMATKSMCDIFFLNNETYVSRVRGVPEELTPVIPFSLIIVVLHCTQL